MAPSVPGYSSVKPGGAGEVRIGLKIQGSRKRLLFDELQFQALTDGGTDEMAEVAADGRDFFNKARTGKQQPTR